MNYTSTIFIKDDKVSSAEDIDDSSIPHFSFINTMKAAITTFVKGKQINGWMTVYASGKNVNDLQLDEEIDASYKKPILELLRQSLNDKH